MKKPTTASDIWGPSCLASSLLFQTSFPGITKENQNKKTPDTCTLLVVTLPQYGGQRNLQLYTVHEFFSACHIELLSLILFGAWPNFEAEKANRDISQGSSGKPVPKFLTS